MKTQYIYTFLGMIAISSVSLAESIGYSEYSPELKTSLIYANSYSTDGSSTPDFTIDDLTFSSPLVGSADGTALVDSSHKMWIRDSALLSSGNGFTISMDLSNITAEANWRSVLSLYTTGAGNGDDKCLQLTGTASGLSLYNYSGFAGSTNANTQKVLASSWNDFSGTVTIVYDQTAKSVTGYVDGVEKGSITFDAADNITGLQIGATFGNGRPMTSAVVDNLSMWSTALTAEQVKSLIVPEPATATLSLLALAGLCARRRRK